MWIRLAEPAMKRSPLSGEAKTKTEIIRGIGTAG
ncbi:hypothetical protein HmCmsJML009_00600 [Escherichia coli]|nr:hypothetical protein HmCmsJML009_00600 [Escherichia coli]